MAERMIDAATDVTPPALRQFAVYEYGVPTGPERMHVRLWRTYWRIEQLECGPLLYAAIASPCLSTGLRTWKMRRRAMIPAIDGVGCAWPVAGRGVLVGFWAAALMAVAGTT